MARPDKLADAEIVAPVEPGSGPGRDIGLGAPVVAQGPHLTAHAPSDGPMTAQALQDAVEGRVERPALTRASFLAKFPLNKSCAQAFVPMAFRSPAEKAQALHAAEPQLGKLT